MKDSEINEIFTYHPPFGTQQERYVEIRADYKALAHKVNKIAPDSREKALAITDLQRSCQMVNAAIAIHEKPE